MNKITHKQIIEVFEDFEQIGSKLEQVARETVREAGLDGEGFIVKYEDSGGGRIITAHLNVEGLVWHLSDGDSLDFLEILQVTIHDVCVMMGNIVVGHDPVVAAKLLKEKLLVPGTFLREVSDE